MFGGMVDGFATQILEGVLFMAAASGDSHGGGWIADFGLVVASAGIAVVVFHFLRLPLLFGYILAGVIIGPHLLPSPLIEDAEAIQQISELGVIFLLFFIGMEFDLKRLQRVLGPAFLALLLQTLCMLYLAQVLAPFLNWNATSTLFFGSLLAISSSMVTVRVLRVSGRIQRAEAQFAIGILILEDILAVILLVILTGVAVTKTFAWDAAWLIIFAMGIFIILVFLIGRLVVPALFRAIGGVEAEPETITVFSSGLVMGVSILALQLDFSPALGAFVAGTLLSQTQVAKRVERTNQSLHDVFSAVFFVSVGMQLDPILLLHQLPVIFPIAGLVILLKVVSCWSGLCLAGQNGRTAFLAATPKAQIGEFSFIIAALGGSLNVMDESMTGLAFGVALVTILFTPPLTARSDWLVDKGQRLVPKRIAATFQAYRTFLEGVSHGLGRSMVLKLIRRPLLQISLYFLLLTGLFVTASIGYRYFLKASMAWVWPWLWQGAYWVSLALILAPFLYAVLRNLNAIAFILTDALFSGRSSRPIYANRLRQMVASIVLGGFVMIFMSSFLLLATPYIPGRSVSLLVLVVLLSVILFLNRQLIRLNSQMEILFVDSFSEAVATKEEERRKEVLDMIHGQSPWPVEIVDLTLPPYAAWSGKRIRELDLRAKYGVNVLALGRGQSVVFDPSPETPVFSQDRLVVSGSNDSIATIRLAMAEQIQPGQRPPPNMDQFCLRQVYIDPLSELDGQTLAGGAVRRRFGVTVIGVQRGEERISNPAPDFLLDAGDVLLVAGLPEKIDILAATCGEKPLPEE
jgi:CPA2 family monovalent cation:H+ antiporter-2